MRGDVVIAFGGVFLLGIVGFVVSVVLDKTASEGERDAKAVENRRPQG